MPFTNNAAANRSGQANATGDPAALFLKVFSGEVLTNFEEFNVMKDLHRMRTITHGKTAQFPVLGTAAAAYHTPGESLIETDNQYLNTIRHGERTISIDKLLVAPIFIAEIDEARNHYDVRSPYSEELGRALAVQFDKQTMQVGYLAARVAADGVFTGAKGGGAVTDASFGTSMADTIDSIFEASAILDGKDIPESDRHVIVSPTAWNDIIQDGVTQSVAIHRDVGGQGSIATRQIRMLAGFQLHKSNHIDTLGNQTGYNDNQEDTGSPDINSYAGDFSNSKSLAFHKSMIGTVKLLDLAMEAEYQVERQGTLLVAKYAMGHGILRPEAAVEIKTA